MAEKVTKKVIVEKLLGEQPDISAKDAVAELGKRGVEMNEQNFYNYKNAWKKGKNGNGKSKKQSTFDFPVPKSIQTEQTVGTSISDVLAAAKRLVDDVGKEEAKKIIDLL